MVRKSSDMALLLGARGRLGQRRGGGGGGFLGSVVSAVQGLFQRNWRSEQRARSGRAIPGWLALGGVLAAFAVGFFTGGRFAGPIDNSGLHAKGGSSPANVSGATPQVIDPGAQDAAGQDPTSQKLGSTALAVTAHQDQAAALELCKYLQSRGLAKARPYSMATARGTAWLSVVYYDGPNERRATIDRLRGLPASDVPDPEFLRLRNQGEEWPRECPIR
ncbi:MAG: hypothetical protein JNL12_14305 [Planctomycetes bacterium]|nr:hypothetical protein [Planctomycetota bacterium]